MSTQNFSFSSATFDYTLNKSDTDGSTLHVQETLVAEFPNFNQNHGIERYIPFTNKGGTNLTVQNQSALNLKVTRNGAPEPFSLEKGDNYYYTRIGNADKYVTDQQTYVLDYDFSRVITEYEDTDTQELYWDTNGTGWSQPFDSLTANIHLPDGVKVVDTSCYVGKYGTKGQDRCTTTKTSDGYSFTTDNLSAGENLTFDLEFPADTFYIPPKPASYTVVIFSAIIFALITLISVLIYKKTWLKVRDNYHWYKNAPVPPQYTPLKGYTVAELAAVSIKPTKEPKVATLLELAISKKISLKKGEKKKLSSKYNWTVTVNTLDDLSGDQLSLLKLFNDGHTPSAGVAYEVKKQKYSSALETAYNEYDSLRTSSLENKGDFLNPKAQKTKSKKTTSKKSSTSTVIWIIIILVAVFTGVPIFLKTTSKTIFNDILTSLNPNYYDVIASWLLWPTILIAILALVIHINISSRLSRYKKYTREGLEHANYLDGLKLYIKMAEADRLKFLQSVDGTDTSNEGIVKLYEKLLPYAALFGLEQSWLSELAHYYKLEDVTEPDWYDVGLAYALSSHSFSNNFSRPIDPSSSSSSGGGGGGFSGGGGGGGGGGGW